MIRHIWKRVKETVCDGCGEICQTHIIWTLKDGFSYHSCTDPACRRHVEAMTTLHNKELDQASAELMTNSLPESQLVQRLRKGIAKCLDAEMDRRADLNDGAPASKYTDDRIAMLKELLTAT